MRAHIVFLAGILLSGSAYSTTINVPMGQPEIQAETDTASDSIRSAGSEYVLSVGERIRVLVPGVVYHRTLDRRLYPATGTIIAIRGDTIVFDGERLDSLATIALSAIQTLDVSRGKRPQVFQYAGLGLLVGAAVGFGIGVATSGDVDKSSDYHTSSRWWGTIFGGVLGLFGGIMISFAVPSEKWEKVPPDELTIGLFPRPGEFVMTASVSF